MMRFLLGVVLGFGVGFAGSVLFAPEKKKEADWVPGQPQASKNGAGGILETVKERVTQAMSEAKDARKQAEREMRDRYERTVNRKSSYRAFALPACPRSTATMAVVPGGVPEWLIGTVSKTVVRLLAYRGFESHPLRHPGR